MKGIYRMPGSKYLWFRWNQGGKRHAVSLKTDDEAVAIVKARAILAEGLGSTNHRDAFSVVSEYLKEAQERRRKPMRDGTAKKKGAVLYKFISDCEVEQIGDIRSSKVEEWLAKLKKAGRSPDTLHTYARDLNTFFRFLVKHRYFRPDHLNDLEIPERGAVGRKNWLKNDEVHQVIAAAEPKDPDLTFVLYCGFHAGLRRNEITNLKVGWFDLGAGLVHVQNDPKSGFILKDKENRSIPITKPFKEFLNKFLAKRDPGEYALRPAKLKSTWVYRYDFSRAWKTHMKRCGVVCTIHDARRSFASNLLSAGENAYTVAKWMGDSVQVVERSYGHLSPTAGNINRLA